MNCAVENIMIPGSVSKLDMQEAIPCPLANILCDIKTKYMIVLIALEIYYAIAGNYSL